MQGRAAEIALHVARGVGAPAAFAQQAHRYAQTDPFKRGTPSPWAPLGLSYGLTGGMLFFSTLAEITGDTSAAAEYLDTILKISDPSLPLFNGWFGTLAVLECAEPALCDRRLLRDMRAQLGAAFVAEWSANGGVHSEYDVINGYAGAMIALRNASGTHFDDVFRAVSEGLRLPSLDPWCRPSRYSGGRPAVNLGLSHGIPGLLAGFALAAPDRYPEAKLDAARYVLGCADTAGGVTYWPVERPASGNAATSRRHAWCYGTPGVVCALVRAAAGNESAELEAAAVRAFESLGSVPISAWELVDCSICHGVSGVMLCALFVAKRTHSEIAWRVAADCAAAVCDAFDVARPLGFVTDPTMSAETNVGFLQGVSGIALALLSATELACGAWTAVLGLGS